jgi:hypothetical protein
MVERVKGRPKARAAQQSARWSRRLLIHFFNSMNILNALFPVCEAMHRIFQSLSSVCGLSKLSKNNNDRFER